MAMLETQSDWIGHPGYGRMFAPDRLTVGVFLPLRFFDGT